MEIIIPSNIIKGYLSKKRPESKYESCKIQRIKSNDKEMIQISLHTKQQVFHSNYNEDEVVAELTKLITNDFTIMELVSLDYTYSYKISSKGKLLTNKRKNKEQLVAIEHNKKKKYLLPEGEIIPALVDLGVMLPDGRIAKALYDKYKQINRFLEIIDDSIKDEKFLRIIDFGCGKSYVTFILYHYLTFIKKIDCEIIGLDLKEDVIKYCNSLVEKYNYKNISFYCGDVAKYSTVNNVDMIITLHACDTATDYALYHAIRMGCKYIFSVPCCQHEINSQLTSDSLHVLNKFGIIKERFSSLLTDSIRANILQYAGYKTQILEFVDFENSPKNLLIRATLTSNGKNDKIKKEIDDVVETYKIDQTLYNLMFKD